MDMKLIANKWIFECMLFQSKMYFLLYSNENAQSHARKLLRGAVLYFIMWIWDLQSSHQHFSSLS